MKKLMDWMNRTLALVALLLMLGPVFAPAAHAISNPLSLTFGSHTFVVPFKQVDATQLYSFKEGRGLPGLQTVLYSYKSGVHFDIGAGPLLGSSSVVPFVSAQFLLPKNVFDPSVGPIWLGPWVGRQFRSAKLGTSQVTLWGLNASIALW